ncbi:hypothetical protein EIP91_002970 [Steccherinum ochraceum]|uniref:NADH:flavin oxidoreductase/NADH oxidase N-terminal domain-containing protein n=1 Tax=Steccherinum ochraceum TaxID=92696 RepID=A0A4R0RER6_9APHY|nr:hypothetical protein EIP91_002970 [Steccherinum ochraceum]
MFNAHLYSDRASYVQCTLVSGGSLDLEPQMGPKLRPASTTFIPTSDGPPQSVIVVNGLMYDAESLAAESPNAPTSARLRLSMSRTRVAYRQWVNAGDVEIHQQILVAFDISASLRTTSFNISDSMSINVNVPRVPRAPNAPYYTPLQEPAAGTALAKQSEGKAVPKIFQPITIRGVTFPNRIWVAPMDMYSSDNGAPTAWHMAHIGGLVTRGAGLTMMEAASVLPNGRISPEDAGLWNDEQMAGYKKIVEFAHSQNQKIGIQIAHAGRKASTRAAWLQSHDFGVGYLVSEEEGGWPNDIIAPTAEAWSAKLGNPRELTVAEIADVVDAWKQAARRAVEAGFDVIELHVRSVIPKDIPLFYRISATEYLEEVAPNEPQWRIEDTVKFAAILAEHGVDLIDLSSGGNSEKQKVRRGHLYQVPFAEAVKKAHSDKIMVGAVGGIVNGKDAEGILVEKKADVVLVGRNFLKNPATVTQFAEDLGVDFFQSIQYEWPFFFQRGDSILRRAQNVTSLKAL